MKLRRFSVLFILLLALGTIFSSAVSAEKNERHNLVALGDSITFGYHLEQNQTKPSPQAFPSLIADGEFNVTNLGVPGWTSANLLNALSTPTFAGALKSADVVTLDIGSNDLLQAAGITLQNTDPVIVTPELLQNVEVAGNQLALNLKTIIATIKQQTDAPIILYNLYNPFGESTNPVLGSLHSVGELIIPSVNEKVIKTAAVQSGSLLVDAYSAFNGKQAKYILPGDIHPTLSGHKALAKLADRALSSLKDRNDDSNHNNSGHHDDSNHDNSGHHDDSNHDNPGHHDDSNHDNPGNDDSNHDNPGDDDSAQDNPENTTPTTPETDPPTPATSVPTPAPSVSALSVSPIPVNATTAYSLPNTATSSYNLLAAGVLLILTGLSAVLIQRMRKNSSSSI